MQLRDDHESSWQGAAEFVAADLACLASCSTRLAIMRLLGTSAQSVGQIARSLGLSYPLVSNHLRTLRAAGLVVPERDGKLVIYSLSPTCRVRDDGSGFEWVLRTKDGCELMLSVPVSVFDAT